MPKTPHLSLVATDQLLILHIELAEIKPTVWRRVAVPERITLNALHEVIQSVMDWSDSHLHEFRIDGKTYGVPEPGWATATVSEQGKTLIDVLAGKKAFDYVYDLGDNWEHHIKVEKTVPAADCPRSPHCLDGANASPPEDAGGAGQYEYLLAALADPDDPDHEAISEWFGEADFDPAVFDRDRINDELKRLTG